MKYLIILSILLCTPSSNAQTVFTIADAPQIGDHFTLRLGTYTDLPQTGPSQIWDYSLITSGAALSHQFEDAAGNAFVDNYPEASLVLTGTGISEFFHVDGSGIFGYGSVGDLGWGQYWLEVPFRRIALPLYHGASWQDDWSGFQGGTVINGERTCIANGSGNLVLPWGTVENVIRVSCTDQVQIGDGSTTIILESVNFYANGFPWDLLKATERVVLENGEQIAPTQRTLLFATEASVVPIEETPIGGPQMFSYIDPSGDLMVVPDKGSNWLDINICNMLGVTVAFKRSSRGTIGIKHLSAGIYVLNAIDGNGRLFRQKFYIDPIDR